MLIKLDRPLNQCKLGILGLRSSIFEPILCEKKLAYVVLQKDTDITPDFDFVFCSGYYYMIPQEILDKVKYGIYVFHETPLPEGKGHAPLQWTVLSGRKNITVTGFRCNAKPDEGPILYQYNMPVDPFDTLPELESKRRLGTQLCFKCALEELLEGYVCLREQTGAGSYTKKRSPQHSELDANKPLKELWDHIRICDNDEFPAFFMVNGKKVILRYECK